MSASHKLGDFTRPALLIGSALVAVAAVAAVSIVASSSSSPPPPAEEPAAPARSLTVAPPPPVEAAAPAPRLVPAVPEAPRPDRDTWPADPEARIRATQRLLGELRLLSEPPSGQSGPVTEAAIREYQRMAGLEETGEVSEALFVSLKEVAAMVFPPPVPAPE